MILILIVLSGVIVIVIVIAVSDVRFGADAVFRAKDNVLSDQDLDAVLERGAKKTKEMQEKLDVADKGDMLDFKFDDNSGVQVCRAMLWYITLR